MKQQAERNGRNGASEERTGAKPQTAQFFEKPMQLKMFSISALDPAAAEEEMNRFLRSLSTGRSR